MISVCILYILDANYSIPFCSRWSTTNYNMAVNVLNSLYEPDPPLITWWALLPTCNLRSLVALAYSVGYCYYESCVITSASVGLNYSHVLGMTSSNGTNCYCSMGFSARNGQYRWNWTCNFQVHVSAWWEWARCPWLRLVEWQSRIVPPARWHWLFDLSILSQVTVCLTFVIIDLLVWLRIHTSCIWCVVGGYWSSPSSLVPTQ
jgi:hypothetical protein